jgi:phage portal protein BeeE
LLGGKPKSDIVSYERRQQYGIYYEMYRQHPIVRSAIDRKAQYAVAGGYHFIGVTPEEKPTESKLKKLKYFFRKSNARQLLRLTYKDLDIFGESFWLIERSLAEARTPLRAMRLNPRFMSPIISYGVVTSWRYGPIAGPDDAEEYKADVILHFRIDDVETDVQGLSPLHSLQRTVAQDLFAMDFNEKFFTNSAQTGIIFIIKHSDGDEAKRNREWLEANYVGTANAHRPMLLEGDVEVAKSVSSRADMQYIEGRHFNVDEILAVLQMSRTRLGIPVKPGAPGEGKEEGDTFQEEVIFPWQSIVEDEINNQLIMRIFGWDDVLFQHLEGDPRRRKDQADLWDKHQQRGRMNINEIRAEMGLGPVSGGDVYAIQTAAGLIPVDIILKVAQRLVVSEVAEPVSGIGTDTFGVNNPPQSFTDEQKREVEAE